MRRHKLIAPAALLTLWLLAGCGSGNTYNPDVTGGGSSFTLGISPSSRTITAGNSATYTVTLTSVDGFSQLVSLSISGLPAGAAGTFNPASVTPTTAGATSTLTITTTGSSQLGVTVVGKAAEKPAESRGTTRVVTPPGTATFTVTGTGGGLTKAATASLVVQAGAVPDFTVTGGGTQTVQQGGTANYNLTVTSVNGFAGQLSGTITGSLPTGVTAQFTPSPSFTLTANGTQAVTVAAQTSANTPTGTYTLNMGATNTVLTRTVAATLTVTAGSSGPAVIATIPDGGRHGIAANPATNRVYGTTLQANTATVIDGATNTLLTSVTGITLAIGAGVDPTRNRIYVADEGDHLYVIDGQTNAIVRTVTGVGSSFRVAVNPQTNKIWVASQSSGFYVVDGTTYAVTSIPVPGMMGASGVAVNTVTNTVYVCGNHQVTVINGATNAIVANLPAAPGSSNARGVAVNETTNRFYVTNQGDGSVGVYDGATNTLLTTVTLPGALNVFDVAVDPGKNRIWVADTGTNNAQLINGADNSVTAVPLGVWSTGVAVNPVTHHVFFTAGGDVKVVDGS